LTLRRTTSPQTLLLPSNSSTSCAGTWDHITATFNAFQHKNPIIEFDVKSLKIFAYPAEEYLNGLSERTREEAKRQHRQAVSDGALQSWRMSHKIAAAGGGYAWPDLELDSDGGSISVRSGPPTRPGSPFST
jgi:hypothetical protein